MAISLDTLRYSQKLQAAGIARKEAEAHAELARDLLLIDAVATSELRDELKQIRREIEKAEFRMVIKVGGVVAAILWLFEAAKKFL